MKSTERKKQKRKRRQADKQNQMETRDNLKKIFQII